jgi:ABC-2 type transport system permease protein
MMRAALGHLRVYAALASASVRSELQYRLNFAIRSVIDFAILIADFVPIYFLVERFGALQGWTFPELALLYGMVSLSWALVELSLQGFEEFGGYLISGELDRWLVRPQPIVLQVAAVAWQARRIGRILQALLVLVVAAFYLELGLAAWAWVCLGIGGGIAFFAGILLLGAASQFWTLGQTSELQNMLTYGGTAMLTYPISIYSKWLRRIATYGVPLAFVNYFPALAALGRAPAAGVPAWVPALAPFVCSAVLALGLLMFGAGLRRYESTGS